jgi:hypothetical protein
MIIMYGYCLAQEPRPLLCKRQQMLCSEHNRTNDEMTTETEQDFNATPRKLHTATTERFIA